MDINVVQYNRRRGLWVWE